MECFGDCTLGIDWLQNETNSYGEMRTEILGIPILQYEVGDEGIVYDALTGKIIENAVEKETLSSLAIAAMSGGMIVDFTVLDASLPEGWTGSNGHYTSPGGLLFSVSSVLGVVEYEE